MKITHVMGHNSNWNVDSYFQNEIGDYFLITAFTFGDKFEINKNAKKILDKSFIDLQFYGKKASGKIGKGSLSDFTFHPANCVDENVTSIYFETCVKEAIQFQKKKGFKNIIVPHFYENEEVNDIVSMIKSINKYVLNNRSQGEKYFMTLPFANHIIIDKQKVEEILFACTDMDICFDGYFIVCENKPDTRKKLSIDIKIFKNLSRVFKVLKNQEFETIYGYANWDAILYLAQTDIDYITIGSYENLRNFDIKRFVEDSSGGPSNGYYFSEKLLNMIKADDLTLIRNMEKLGVIKNEKNIFSEIILKDGYQWNIHKPDVNKNYFLSVTKLLKDISQVNDIEERKRYVLRLINKAIENYDKLENHNIFLNNESSNYHLNAWKTYLSNS